MTRPGVYSLSIGNRTIPIAVNVPANEADVRVLPPETVKKALGDIELAMEDDSAQLAGLKADSSNDWSWAFMATVLALAALECFLAMRFGHYKRGKRLTSPTPEPTLATGN